MNDIKLFCFPHLGGSASIYYQWKTFFSTGIEICPIELAGRGERNKEPFYRNFEELIIDVANRIIDTNIKNCGAYAFWGHSMGALIAYEAAYFLMDHEMDAPVHIFFSGRNAPDIKDDMLTEDLDDDSFINRLNWLGGIPKAIFDYPELVSVILPVLKADYQVMRTYGFNLHKRKIKSDITIITGDNDASINYRELEKWRLLTEKKCSINYMSGGHFYMENNLEDLIELIKTVLAKY